MPLSSISFLVCLAGRSQTKSPGSGTLSWFNSCVYVSTGFWNRLNIWLKCCFLFDLVGDGGGVWVGDRGIRRWTLWSGPTSTQLTQTWVSWSGNQVTVPPAVGSSPSGGIHEQFADKFRRFQPIPHWFSLDTQTSGSLNTFLQVSSGFVSSSGGIR